tara:strand:- start:479 stop:1363 length:885 start_codon:yes stop_codon:yes gene_type:complete
MSDRKFDIGLLVLGYCRADLFERAARSLEHLGLGESTPRYGVIDGARTLSGPLFDDCLAVQQRAKKLLDEGVLTSLTIRNCNLGTMNNVYTSVSEILSLHEFVFVLEDDLEILQIADCAVELLLPYLNERVSAFGIYCNKSFSDSLFFSQRFSSQAWGTSREAWAGFNPVHIMSLELSEAQRIELRKNVGGDFISSFRAFQSGDLDSWAIPWNIYNFLQNRVMLYTPNSYVNNNSHLLGAERTYGIEFEYEISRKSLSLNQAKQPQINLAYLRHFGFFARFARRLRAEYIKRCR